MGFIPHRTKASGAARGGMSSSPDTIMARLPPLTSMEAFLEVARHGTVKAAASELGLSMPALSRRIQTLEHAVGRPLFDRHHHGLKLTEARSEEHTSELQSLMRNSYAVFCLKKKKTQ